MKSLWMVAALAALALAGCTQSSGDGYVVPPMEDGHYVIEMKDGPYRFVPEKAVVPVGATVVWKNHGTISHNVHAEDNAWQQSPVSTNDFTLTLTESHLGTHAYVCDPHQGLGMTGSLKVVSVAEFDAMDDA